MCVRENIFRLQEELPHEVTLVAVSKTHPVDVIAEAYETGQRIFGENRPQELKIKWETLPKNIEWHLLGHLQTNKVRMIMPIVSLIHSVDSVRLLELIDKEAERINRSIDVLLEVHIAQEETKHGWQQSELLEYIESGLWRELKSVNICGLMCVATNSDDEAVVGNEFRAVKQLFDGLQPTFGGGFTKLSMGMSSDYKLAIECGSNMVRIGSTIFGNRSYNK